MPAPNDRADAAAPQRVEPWLSVAASLGFDAIAWQAAPGDGLAANAAGLLALLPPPIADDVARVSATLHALLAGLTPRAEVTYMATDYRTREAVVALDGPSQAPLQATGLVRDVHDRSSADARRTSWLTTLVDQLPEAVVAWVDGREVERNRRARVLLGSPGSSPDLVGLLAQLHPVDREAVTLHLAQAKAAADPPAVVARLAGGPPERWVELSSSALQTPEGPAILSVIRDVTERRRLELESAAQNRMATVGTLAAGVAHEINNPLCFMQLNLEMLRDDLPAVLDQLTQSDAAAREQARSDLASRLDEVLTGAGRVRAVVSDLKVFSHTRNTEPGVVDVVEAVRLAINLGRHQLRHRAEIELCAAGPVFVMGSLGKLSQVFLNLLANAAQAISDGGVSDGRVRVEVLEHDDDTVEVLVADNGPGLDAAVGDRVFDPFYTSKAVGDGTGLGLSISLSIVQGLGGTLGFDPPDGQGARARVRLPRADGVAARGPTPGDPEGAAVAHPPQQRLPRLRRSILVADDEELLRKALERRLSRDFDVRSVPDGVHVVELLEAGASPDALLLDVMMPRLDGPGVLHWIERNRPALRDRVVFMTGGAVTSSARSFLADTPNLTFGKPLQVEAMVAQLHMLLDAPPPPISLRDAAEERAAAARGAPADTPDGGPDRRSAPRGPAPDLRASLEVGATSHVVDVLDLSTSGLRVSGGVHDELDLLSLPLTLHLVHAGTQERVALPVRYVRSRADGEHRELGFAVRPNGQGATDVLQRWVAA